MPLATDRQRVAHLLRRAGFGATPEEVESYAKLGVDGAVERLLSYSPGGHGVKLTPADLLIGDQNLNPLKIAAWWLWRMLATRQPLQEKLALFWHDHFAITAAKVNHGAGMYQYVALLQEHGAGGFPALLHAVAKSPAMVFFLDTQTSRKGQPNENFARELFELYTLGIGNYSEADVQEAARAFTGWGIERPGAEERKRDVLKGPAFRFRKGIHDFGPKTVLSVTGSLSGEEVIDIALGHPATARHITRKLWEWFAYYSPDSALVEQLAADYSASGLDTRQLLRTIFTHDEFYSQRAERVLYKSPADFVIGTLRALRLELVASRAGLDKPRTEEQQRGLLRGLRGIGQAMVNMGMVLLAPPTVAGWDGGASWANSAALLARINFADDIYNTQAKLPPQALLGQNTEADAARVLALALSRLDAQIGADKQRAILAETEKIKVKAGDENDMKRLIAATLRMVFACPEYQFC